MKPGRKKRQSPTGLTPDRALSEVLAQSASEGCDVVRFIDRSNVAKQSCYSIRRAAQHPKPPEVSLWGLSGTVLPRFTAGALSRCQNRSYRRLPTASPQTYPQKLWKLRQQRRDWCISCRCDALLWCYVWPLPNSRALLQHKGELRYRPTAQAFPLKA